ncbi:hypothetical protein D9M68_694810 [compost metagenome]
MHQQIGGGVGDGCEQAAGAGRVHQARVDVQMQAGGEFCPGFEPQGRQGVGGVRRGSPVEVELGQPRAGCAGQRRRHAVRPRQGRAQPARLQQQPGTHEERVGQVPRGAQRRLPALREPGFEDQRDVEPFACRRARGRRHEQIAQRGLRSHGGLRRRSNVGFHAITRLQTVNGKFN